jgi:glutamate carboxypeptidase
MNLFFEDLKKIIEINSYTQNKRGVDKVGKVFQKWFEEIGFETNIYKRELIGNHLLFTTPKKNGKKILFLGHLDTVFPEGKFEHYKEDEEWVYGPGVCDMKGGNLVALQSIRNQNSKIYNIDILLVSDEETGSDDSKLLTKEIAKNYDECFVFEAAGENLEVVTGRKGVGTFFVDIKGKASHSGVRYFDGINANLEAAHKLIKLQALTDLEKGSTVNVGKIEGGIGANTISPHAHLTFEIRYETSKERDRILNSINEIVETSYVEGTSSVLSGSIQRDVMQENSSQLELIKELEKISNEKILTEKRGGVSDANIVASSGVTTLDGFGPFGDGDHTIYERALKSSFNQRINLMTKYIKNHQNSLN